MSTNAPNTNKLVEESYDKIATEYVETTTNEGKRNDGDRKYSKRMAIQNVSLRKLFSGKTANANGKLANKSGTTLQSRRR